MILGTTPTHDSVITENADNVQILWEYGADINAVDSQRGYTPLCRASSFGNVKAVKWLLEHGADWTIQSIDGIGLAEAEVRQEYDAKEFPEEAATHQWILDFLEK